MISFDKTRHLLLLLSVVLCWETRAQRFRQQSAVDKGKENEFKPGIEQWSPRMKVLPVQTNLADTIIWKSHVNFSPPVISHSWHGALQAPALWNLAAPRHENYLLRPHPLTRYSLIGDFGMREYLFLR